MSNVKIELQSSLANMTLYLCNFSMCFLISQFTENKHLAANKGGEISVFYYYKLDFM